ncbi:sulfotransferase-like domain-containing protein [Solicola gregarius]|uniref:HAD family hydrolase n=1 Tax=Solicola gregarius TaxID=2908642 RepID=A0AA46TK79_9ACTN|nr:HAD family hydrolase [Solicola gregarius]UYM06648.1 HAD family hydrolase [Solicola gregarius]
MTVRVAMWSGPRNISTALMRSWENRPDTAVLDEPMYAAYLSRTRLDHPGRDEIIASQDADLGRVVEMLLSRDDAAVLYAKHMAQHVPDDMDLAWTLRQHNALLIREPREVVASYVRARESCEPADIGLLQQSRLHAYWREHDLDVPVIDSADFLQDPEAYLRHLCAWAGIVFDAAMLSWPAGPRDSDGVWAKYWYDAVHASTGFSSWHPREVTLSEHDSTVAEACREAYDDLRATRLRI